MPAIMAQVNRLPEENTAAAAVAARPLTVSKYRKNAASVDVLAGEQYINIQHRQT